MSTRMGQLQAAIVELLEAGDRTATQLQEELSVAGAPFHLEMITSALTKLGRGRRVRLVGDGVFKLIRPPMSDEERGAEDKACAKCGVVKPRSTFIGSNSYCRPCMKEYGREYRKRQAEAKNQNRETPVKDETPPPIPVAPNGLVFPPVVSVVKRITLSLREIDSKSPLLVDLDEAEARRLYAGLQEVFA